MKVMWEDPMTEGGVYAIIHDLFEGNNPNQEWPSAIFRGTSVIYIYTERPANVW